MKKNRKSCKDVFHSFMLENTDYEGKLQIPIINGNDLVPNKLMPFSKMRKATEFDGWIHFFEHDYVIDRIWKYPKRYLPLLKNFEGVITPDFSLYRDMPLVMQFYNIFRSRTIGNWLEKNGVNVIVNIRYSDERTYKVACQGVKKNSIIALGTHGAMKEKEDREYIEKGFKYILENLRPKVIVIYGTVSEFMKKLCENYNVKLIIFQSEIGKKHLRKKEVQ